MITGKKNKPHSLQGSSSSLQREGDEREEFRVSTHSFRITL